MVKTEKMKQDNSDKKKTLEEFIEELERTTSLLGFYKKKGEIISYLRGD